MKKTFLIILAAIIAFSSFSQEKSCKITNITEVGFHSSFISNTKNIDNHFKKLYKDDYKTSFIPTVGVSFAYGFYFCKKFGSAIDVNYNAGISLNEKTKEQYKRINSYAISLNIEYDILQKEHYNLILKTGYGIDNTSFLYTRKAPLDIVSYSCNNGFIPINLGIWIHPENSKKQMLGVFLQYNVLVNKDDTKYTGIDYDLQEKVPNVSQNNLMFGIKYRF